MYPKILFHEYPVSETGNVGTEVRAYFLMLKQSPNTSCNQFLLRMLSILEKLDR